MASIIQGSSNFTINGGQFTVVHGSQHVTVHKSASRVVEPVYGQEMRPTRWDDYRLIRTGSVYVTKAIGETTVKKPETVSDREEFGAWSDVDACRHISHVCRVPGEDRETEFLHVSYEGADAFKAFILDFDRFSSVKKPHVAQLFGYNDNERGMPALLFYDALIPLGHILVMGDRLSPILYPYFANQLYKMKRVTSIGTPALGVLWVDPGTGALREGPYVEIPSFSNWIMDSFGEKMLSNNHFPPLSIQTYSNNDVVFDYLKKILTPRTILRGLCWSFHRTWQHFTNEQALYMLPSLPGAIYNRRTRDLLARWAGAKERWFYKLWRVFGFPDTVRDSQVGMADGTSREEHSIAQESPDLPREVFLFILPVPRPSDGTAAWKSWMDSEKYFWSFNSFGRGTESNATQAFTRLPSFECTISIRHDYWNYGHYDAMRMLHEAEGFRPTTTDLARSVGLPLLEAVRDDDWFEGLQGTSSRTMVQHGGQSKAQGM
ncbi:hypothetical protein VNI00_012535 [Paramarasmius palmivorus]|uniref:Uncharacterized protein n=1 Tax=Paramarasmius palmivorus TaxID=297713 RepID=A0AAW0C431_9AGAR